MTSKRHDAPKFFDGNCRQETLVDRATARRFGSIYDPHHGMVQTTDLHGLIRRHRGSGIETSACLAIYLNSNHGTAYHQEA